MKDYREYTLQDFLQDDDFRDWVQGTGRTDRSIWYSFPERFPEKMDLLNQAERIIRAAGQHKSILAEREIRTEVEALLEKISSHEQSVPSPKKRKVNHVGILPWLGAACLLAYLLIDNPQKTSTVDHLNSPEGTTSSSNLVVTRNDTEKPLRILLSDNSVVLLSPNSSLQYPSEFSDSSRIVHMTGEANFSVEKGSKAFIVYAGDVVTKVLGTKFVVKAYSNDKNTTVQVETGTVSVFKTKTPGEEKTEYQNTGLIITANQAAVFEKSIRQLTKTLVSDPVKLAPTIDFAVKRYDEMNLSEILRDIEKAYGITILCDKKRFEKCKITATFSDENMYEKLDLLCKSIDASYEIVDGQILIVGKGC
jgi:transmembrane sensor